MHVRIEYTGDPEEVCDWVFTFGYGHTHPATGESLANHFTRIRGTFTGARAKMFSLFGSKWSHQYATPEDAGVDRWAMIELKRADWPEKGDG